MGVVRGLMMGRFQPPHLGHMGLVRQVLDECDEVIVAVTSSQYNYLAMDPFTAGERIDMIRGSLMDEGVSADRYMILGIENQHNVAIWASYLKAALPHFDKVYSGNPYVVMLLADSGISVVQPRMMDRDVYNSTAIRQAIASDEPWQDRVPAAVARLIRSMGGVDRIKTIMASDTNPTTH